MAIIVVAIVFVITSNTSKNTEVENKDNHFVFLGEAANRPENFNHNTVVTPNNIENLYVNYIVYPLFEGDYYLIRSKKSYKTSRYLSRLIHMKNGRQVAAQTFYDTRIEPNHVLRIKSNIIVGLNSLDINNYDSTFQYTSNQCRVVVLSENLTPLKGKKYYCKEGRTSIETLLQNSDDTFLCSIKTERASYQFVADNSLYIKDNSKLYDNIGGSNVENESLKFDTPDWANDISDEKLLSLKKQRNEDDRKITAGNEDFHDKDSINQVGIANLAVPKDFVLVPAGTLKNEKEWNDNREVVYNVSVDSFYICKYELTQAEYKRIVGTLLTENYTWNIQIDNKDAKVVKQGDSIPVVGTYQEFAEYCNKRSRMEGYDGFYEIDGSRVEIKHNGNGYRLLNHFEWTYAARGGNANERYSYAGSNNIREVAWYGGNSEYRPHEVGKKKANSLGVFDMSGNVSEMLLDDPKSPYRLIGGEGFEYWVNLGPDDILGMYEKNRRNGTRIALIPKRMTNNNTKLTWKYKW